MKNLENKRWYRFLKVVYVFFFVLSIGYVLIIASINKPYTYVDSDKSSIICNNGNGYYAGENSIYIDSDGSLSSYNDEYARKLCYHGTIYGASSKVPISTNYEVKVVHTTEGSWGSAISAFLIGTGIVIVIFEIIKRVFLYIVMGKSFFSKSGEK